MSKKREQEPARIWLMEWLKSASHPYKKRAFRACCFKTKDAAKAGQLGWGHSRVVEFVEVVK